MRRRIILSVWFLAVFSLGIAAGHLMSVPIRLPASGGDGAGSPDGKMSAGATSWTDSPLLGQSRTYSEFLIETPDLKVVRRVRIEDSAYSADHVPIDWREEGQIQWATNSSAVTFSYDGPHANFQMILKIQP